MKPTRPVAGLTAVALSIFTAAMAPAQQDERQEITEKDKQVFRDFKEGLASKVAHQELKAHQTRAVMSLRQIGLALFEFETEFGFFPNADTAAVVKEATGYKGELRADTANDCFFQLVAAGIVRDRSIFVFDEKEERGAPDQKPVAADRIGKCAFAYVPAKNSAASPRRPIAVAPLIKGTTLFDPKPFGGRAVILKVDNSVSSAVIEKDGRVLVDGRDLFDPEQAYWQGDVPEIKWPAE